jgi:cytoskeletal protein RodZ
MASLGDTLRQARKSRRVAIRDVARETRIDTRYLAALEKNELTKLPGGAFDRGFVRTYADFLGLDPDELARMYDQELEKQRVSGKIPEPGDLLEKIRSSVGHRSLPSSTAGRWWLVLGIGAVVAALGAGAWLWVEESRETWEPLPERAASRPEPVVARAAPRAEPQPARQTPPPEAAPERSTTEPPSQPETEPTPEPETEPPPLSVPESGVGTEVVDLRLRGETGRFEAGDAVYFWTRVVGGEPGQLIRHVWRHEGQRVGFVPLELGGSHWRTYSRRELPADGTGRWTVEAVDTKGRVLASHSFRCVPQTTRPARNDPPTAEAESGPEGA